MQLFLNSNGLPVLTAMIETIQANKKMLSDIDGLIGDGDHGANMNKGFTIFENRLSGDEVSLAEGLDELGTILLAEIGGSMGPIYGTIFISMAEAIENVIEINSVIFLSMLDSAIFGLHDVITAKVGEKTLMDSLVPARDAFRDTLESGENFTASLKALRQAAATGRDATLDMVAKHGRASRLGERSRGVPDAGATSCCLLLDAMADSISQRLE